MSEIANNTIYTVYGTREDVEISPAEALRYMGVRQADDVSLQLLESCQDKANRAFTYRAVFARFAFSLEGDTLTFPFGTVRSADLAAHLAGCEYAYVMAATAGHTIDRLISKYSALQPSHGLAYQAMGAAGIEAWCDHLCRFLQQQEALPFTPRFSPGYGDLPLSYQPQILSLLDTDRRIGISLSEGGMMLPTKSVTAFMGVHTSFSTELLTSSCASGCGSCRKDCAFRREDA